MKTMKPFKNNSSSLHAVLDEYRKHMRKALHHQQEAYFYLVEALDMVNGNSVKHTNSASEETPDWIKERFGELDRRIERLERAVFIGPQREFVPCDSAREYTDTAQKKCMNIK